MKILNKKFQKIGSAGKLISVNPNISISDYPASLFCTNKQTNFTYSHHDQPTNDLCCKIYQTIFPSIPETITNFNWDYINLLWRENLNLTNISYEEKYISASVLFNQPSNIFSNEQKIDIKFLTSLSKETHAFVIFYFPSENSDDKHPYILTTLLVGYLLRTQRQNLGIGTQATTICCITSDVEVSIRNMLENVYDIVQQIPLISWSEKADIRIQDISKNHISENHAYAKVLTKLNALTLPYKKIIILDADLYPLCFFDSLFSIPTPAGCLEHRRSLLNQYGCHTWKPDRSLFAQHGQKIPRILTDLTNKVAADINASLLIFSPDTNEFNQIIKKLQTPTEDWFSKGKKHSGVWLGDKFYDYYLLPEQNFLTQNYSGEWYSVDFGFSSWCLEMNQCFGFTFAGFVVKPWLIQSANHQYSVNSFVDFSRINNEYTQRSLACQILNVHLSKMIFQYPEFTKFAQNIQICFEKFDPWFPEKSFDNSKMCSLLEVSNERDLSFDQRLLYNIVKKQCLHNLTTSLHKLNRELNFLQICAKIQPVSILILKRQLVNQLNNLIKNVKTTCFESRIVAISTLCPYKLTEELITRGFKVLAFIRKRFIQIITPTKKPLYLHYKKTKYRYLQDMCLCNLAYLNVSFYDSILREFYYKHPDHKTSFILGTDKKTFFLQSPYIEIYFEDCKNLPTSKPLIHTEEKLVEDCIYEKLYSPERTFLQKIWNGKATI